jgi:hypothetical protein
VFHGVAGNGRRIYDAWMKDASNLNCTRVNGCLTDGETLLHTAGGQHLTSPLLSSWNTLGVKQVSLFIIHIIICCQDGSCSDPFPLLYALLIKLAISCILSKHAMLI